MKPLAGQIENTGITPCLEYKVWELAHLTSMNLFHNNKLFESMSYEGSYKSHLFKVIV